MYKFIILTSISSALENVFKTQIQPEIKGVADIAMYVIAAVLLIALIARGVVVGISYHQGGDFKWVALLVLFIGIVVAASAPSWMWTLIGW